MKNIGYELEIIRKDEKGKEETVYKYYRDELKAESFALNNCYKWIDYNISMIEF